MPTFRGREFQLKSRDVEEARAEVVRAAEKVVGKITAPHKLSKRGQSSKLSLWEAVQELHHWERLAAERKRTGSY